MIHRLTGSLATVVFVGMTMALAGPAPTTAPAVVGDFSSPLATLRTGKLAMKTGDVALMRRCYYTTDPEEEKALQAIVESLAMKVRFQEACAKRFGEDAGERVAPEFNLEVPPDAREEIEGDRAELYNVGGSRPTTLRRVDGEWRFTYGSLVDNNFRDLPPMRPAKLATVFQAGSEMYRTLCDDVAAGKFEFVEDAMSALRDRRAQYGKKIDEIVGRKKNSQ